MAAEAAQATHIVVNTCGFIQDAKEESIAAILEAVSAFPRTPVLVMGCLVERYRAELETGIPEVAGWFGLSETDALITALGRTRPAAITAGLVLPGAYGYVKISDGCDHLCSFCAIPAIKGPYAALPVKDILAQATSYLDAGARELVLVGQDTAIWRDGHTGLAELVGLLGGDERLWRIRLMYLQPEHVGDDLLELVAEHPKVVPYLDIPFQHASRRLLARMGRKGDAVQYLALLDRARRVMPDVSLRSTFIVGFPGETEADFQALLDFVTEAGFDHAGAFLFSPEEGTAAAHLRPRVRPEVARERLARLSDILVTVSEVRIARLLGTRVEVLVDAVGDIDGPAGVRAVGRTGGQAPEVDGVTYLERSLPPGTARGDRVPALVTGALGYDLVARWDAAQPS